MQRPPGRRQTFWFIRVLHSRSTDNWENRPRQWSCQSYTHVLLRRRTDFRAGLTISDGLQFRLALHTGGMLLTNEGACYSPQFMPPLLTRSSLGRTADDRACSLPAALLSACFAVWAAGRVTHRAFGIAVSFIGWLVSLCPLVCPHLQSTKAPFPGASNM